MFKDMYVLQAVEMCDITTYAAYFAEGKIRRLLRECSGPCHVPRQARERTMRIRRLGDELAEEEME